MELLRAKLKHLIIAMFFMSLVVTANQSGMPAVWLTKRLWIIIFLSFYIFCGVFSISIKGFTYLYPSILFREKLQETLDKVFLMLPAISFCIYVNSFFVHSLQYIVIEYEFAKDDYNGVSKGSEWFLEIIFRIMQVFFALTYLALMVSLGWVHDFEEWIDRNLEDYYANMPSQLQLDLRARTITKWKSI